MQGSAGADALELLVDLLDPARDSAAVGFELRLARAPSPETAAGSRHLGAMSGEPRQHVVELRQLDLQPAFPGACTAGEDIENDLGAVDDLDPKLLFEIALLSRCQVAVEDDQRRAGGGDR